MSEDKKPDISHLPRGAISIKGLPVSRNARLPSIRIPRDLTLGAQPKRTFKPNIPVRREKRPVEQKKESDHPPDASNSAPNKDKATPSKNERGRGRGKGRGRELIQMEGALFEQGIAAVAKDRSKDPSFSRSGFSSGRASSGRKMKSNSHLTEISSSDMDTLLRDDFIDDGSDDEDLKTTGPVMFPIQEKLKIEPDKIIKKEKIDKDFNDANFAKDLGFDVQKISKFIKKEKTDKVTVKPTKEEIFNLPKSDVTDLIKNDEQLFLIKFPHCFTTRLQEHQSKNRAENTPSTEKETSTSISQLPEGRLGKIQILKSGQARLVVGSLNFQMDYVKQLPTKHELVSVYTEAGDISVLANVKHLLNVSPDIVGSLTSLKLDS